MPVAGIEYTLPKLRDHYTLPIGRMHFTLPNEGDSMRSTAREIREITTDEVRVVSVDFRFKLDDGETLTGTPTVTVPTGSGLVFTQKQVNASPIVVNGVSLAAGLAIQFKAAATAATVGDYSVNILCGTSAGQTVQGRVRLSVVAAA